MLSHVLLKTRDYSSNVRFTHHIDFVMVLFCQVSCFFLCQGVMVGRDPLEHELSRLCLTTKVSC